MTTMVVNILVIEEGKEKQLVFLKLGA